MKSRISRVAVVGAAACFGAAGLAGCGDKEPDANNGVASSGQSGTTGATGASARSGETVRQDGETNSDKGSQSSSSSRDRSESKKKNSATSNSESKNDASGGASKTVQGNSKKPPKDPYAPKPKKQPALKDASPAVAAAVETAFGAFSSAVKRRDVNYICTSGYSSRMIQQQSVKGSCQDTVRQNIARLLPVYSGDVTAVKRVNDSQSLAEVKLEKTDQNDKPIKIGLRFHLEDGTWRVG